MIIGISGKIGSGKDTVGKIIQYLTYQEENGIPKNFKDFSEGYNSVFKPSWQIKKFAGKLKQIVALLTGCTVEQLEDNDFKNQKLSKEWNIPLSYLTNDDRDYDQTVKYTYRKLLQNVGTEAMRNTIHPNIWVLSLFVDYKSKFADKDGFITTELESATVKWKDHPTFEPSHFPNWIITDTRFPNELKAVKDRNGITIRCNRNLQKFEDGSEMARNKTFFPQHSHPSETALDNATFDYVLDNNGTIDELVEQVKQILIKEKII